VVFLFVFFILFLVTFFLSNDIKNNKFKRLNFIVQTYCRSLIFDGVRVAHLFSFFVLSYYVSLRSEFYVSMSDAIAA